MRLVSLDELINEQGSKRKALTYLQSAGIPVIHDYFDVDRLVAHKAYLAQPPVRNKAETLEWGLAPTHGIGAIKTYTDSVGLRITAHYLRGNNALDLVDAKGNKQHVKLYYTNRVEANGQGTFTFTNFLSNEQVAVYAGCAFEGPTIWAIQRSKLIQYWNRFLKKKDGFKDGNTIIRATSESLTHLGGRLTLRFAAKSPYLLSRAK